MICGRKDKNSKELKRVLEVKVPSFEVCAFPFMVKPRKRFTVINLNNDLLAFGGDANYSDVLKKSMKSIEIYSHKTNSWQNQYIQIEERFYYLPCLFRKMLFIIGGSIKSSDKTLKCCFSYNMKEGKCNKIAHLNEAKDCAACTVFEGKIVVSGGECGRNGHLKSVEAYDYYLNRWTYLPHD